MRLNAPNSGIKLSLRSPQDQGFFLFMGLIVLAYLFLNRNTEVEGSSLSYPAVVLPGILGALIVFNLVIGPGYSIAMEREDGTLLRARAAPNGVLGHMAGHILGNTLGLIPSLAVILIPSAILFDDLNSNGLSGWTTMLWVTLLGILATLPIGLMLGAVVPGVQKMGTWGMLPVIVLLATSGILFPIQNLWGWIQILAQAFPMYWLGLGMRSAFLPDSAAALEIGGSWRTLETVLVLGAWAAVGIFFTPRVLRRMARRQSGSEVEAARHEAVQWVR